VSVARVGSGAGYAGDRWEPAAELVERGELDYLVFETLAERTIALGQLERLRDPERGYNPQLVPRLSAVLGEAARRGVRIVSNMGAAHPLAAGRRTLEVARACGIERPRVAVLTGDDVTAAVRDLDATLLETGEPLDTIRDRIVAANAYLGADAVLDALATDAPLVLTGRVADPSLFLACLRHAHGWSGDDWTRLGRGTVVGHLLECAGQVTGGYFADPGRKDVPDLARLGFPLAEVADDGDAVVTKVAGSGGRVTTATCKEQLLYEVHDPACYVTPDCIADFSTVTVREEAPDRVAVRGGDARARTGTLKVSVGYRAGWIGEGHVGYAGPGAVARGRLAADIVRARLAARRVPTEDLRIELVGVESLHGAATRADAAPYEVRLRAAARTLAREHAQAVAEEVQTLLTNGPYGGGGDFVHVREVIGVRSILLPRDAVRPRVEVLGA
jgi:hypothetical protein